MVEASRRANGDPNDRVREAFRSIGHHAHAVNLSRAARLADALAVAGGGRLDDAQRKSATDLAHQLVGSAGTFGFPGASQLAGDLERFFADGAFDDPERLAAARAQLGQLQVELAAEPADLPEPSPEPGLTEDQE